VSRRPGEPVSVGTVLGRVLADLGLDSTSAALRLGSIWEEAVGEEIARHARPEALRGRLLEVRVDSSTWCQQLQLRRDEILAGLRRVLGDAAPDDVRLRVG
jgi:predicted nucleic acid-binding Zn ribbon protein